MDRFRLYRPGNTNLAFNGVLLADLHSRENEKQLRWQIVRIYRTESGRYVGEVIGRSVVPGEKDRVNVKVVDEASGLKQALMRRTKPPYLTDLAVEALEVAAEHDPAIATILEERI